ncbi:MAG: hypothetical protein ABI718_12025 [Acidobacteriota bacterium]
MFISILLFVAFTPRGDACGDKMVQIGRGVRYQRAKAVRPATIVMVAGQQFPSRSMSRLGSELTMVGHHVIVVEGPSMLAPILRQKHVDIVLSARTDLKLVSEAVAAAPSKPRIIPMIARPAKNAPSEIREQSGLVMLVPARAVEQIALINQAMK